MGHVFSKEGIAVDQEKIRAIMEWVALKSVDEVRSFMGLAGYYRKFIKSYHKLFIPLHHCKGKVRGLNGKRSVRLVLNNSRSC